jgi:hypothetical protein
VAAVPVTDLGQFLDSLKDLGLTVDDQPGVAGFSHKVSVGDGNVTLFVLESKGFALFSLVPGDVDKIRAMDPSSWTRKVRPETALSVRVQLSEISESFKDLILNQMEAQVDKDRERKPGEDEAEFRGRLAGENLASEAIKSMLRDGDAIALDLDLSRKTSEIAVEVAVTARPGTAMAKNLRAFGEKRSRFEGLGQDAALSARGRLPMAKEFRDVMSQNVDKEMKRALEKLDSAEQKKLLTRFNELMKSNLDAPEVDLGLAIRRSESAGPGAPHFVILSGMSLRDGREFERLMRDAVAQIQPDQRVKVTFDVAKAADGTAIHQVTGPFDEKDADLVKHFGKASLSLAFRDDAVLVSFGEDSPAPLRRAIEGFSNPPAAGPEGPVAMVARVARLGDFAEEHQEEFRRAVAEIFPGDAVKRDRISLGLKGEGDAIRLRLAIDVPALKLMAALGKAMHK